MVRDIVPKFPANEQAAWKEAADTWRLPYWDWASNGSVPKLGLQPEITVTMPPGVSLRIDNPLYQFKMPNDKTMGSEGVVSIKGDEGVELAVCHGSMRASGARLT